MKMFRLPFLFLFLTSTCFAEMSLFQVNEEPKISVQNAILAKVNGNTISVIDVMKKMDLLLHQNYPQYAEAPQARLQFYTNSWRPIFMEMIDTELMLADAQEKEVKLTEGEVREEMEDRFGPSVLTTLDKIGISYEDAWKMVKNELIVRRMVWFFVQSKALQSVSPQSIRDAYRSYLAKNPAYNEWKYRVISVRAEDPSLVQEVQKLFAESGESPESAALVLKEWQEKHPDCPVQISKEFSAKDQELSDAHKSALASLTPGSFGEPVAQFSRAEGKTINRIFYLAQKNEFSAPTFEDMANQLKNELVQKSAAKESEVYLQKLRKHYGFDPARLKENVPDNLNPFHLE